MSRRSRYGGIIHTYQKYDPLEFPSPTAPPADVVSPALNHWLAYGNMRELTEEELARAVRIDPSQIAGLGPSLDALIAMLLERRRKILEKYETDSVQLEVRQTYERRRRELRPPSPLRKLYEQASRDEQIYELERVWYAAKRDQSPFARGLVQLLDLLGDKYQIDELASKYPFTGRTSLSIPEAIEIKQILETIDELLKQLEEAKKNAQIALIDLEKLAEFAETADIQQLQDLQKSIEEHVRAMAEQQGLDTRQGSIQLTPQAMRLFQGRLLERIFSDLQESRTGRHAPTTSGEGAVELPQTKPYEFGDSITQMDIPQSLVNAMIRQGSERPVRLRSEDLEVHRTKSSPKCATTVIMDMSGSMRYDGQYINVKRMALAFEGLIRREFPGDFLQFIEMYTVARVRRSGEILELMPKPVTIYDPTVALKVDMSRDDVSEQMLPPHFTNIQHALKLSRQILSVQDSPNRQIMLITDGLPTAHFAEQWLYLLYPPNPVTEEATHREGLLCAQEGITINIFLLPSWSQSEEDIRFAYRLAEATQGRVFFTAGRDLDRYVLWDYVQRKREILQ
jgi:uncharacterized protein with von Willebrand factor type A (vWA) domain